MKLLYATVLGIAALTLFSCHKDTRGLKDPQPLLLKPMHNGARLSDDVLNQVTLTYYINLTSTHKEQVADFGRAAGTGYQQGILSSSDVASLSGEDNVKTFYLSFPDGTTDTLIVDYESISEDQARQNPCFCKLPQERILINRHPAIITGYNTDSVPVYMVPR